MCCTGMNMRESRVVKGERVYRVTDFFDMNMAISAWMQVIPDDDV